MQFKITILTGVIFVLISSISIAKPISKDEMPSAKKEQIYKKKPNFIQKIILKRITKNEHDKEKASRLSKASLWLSIISLPLAFIGVGAITALAAIVIGIIALTRAENNPKSKTFASTGIGLSITIIILGLLILWGVWTITQALGG